MTGRMPVIAFARKLQPDEPRSESVDDPERFGCRFAAVLLQQPRGCCGGVGANRGQLRGFGGNQRRIDRNRTTGGADAKSRQRLRGAQTGLAHVHASVRAAARIVSSRDLGNSRGSARRTGRNASLIHPTPHLVAVTGAPPIHTIVLPLI